MPGNSPIFPSGVKGWRTQIVAADASALKTIITAAAGGERVDMILVSTDDTAPREIQFQIGDGANDNIGWTVAVPAGAGNTAAVPVVSGLNRSVAPFLSDDGALLLPAAWTLKAKMTTSVTAAKTTAIQAFGGEFSA